MKHKNKQFISKFVVVPRGCSVLLGMLDIELLVKLSAKCKSVDALQRD